MVSNGQLLAMGDAQRVRYIETLPLEVRVRLANIAALGAAKLLRDADAPRATVGQARMKRDKAGQFMKLVADLTRDEPAAAEPAPSAAYAIEATYKGETGYVRIEQIGTRLSIGITLDPARASDYTTADYAEQIADMVRQRQAEADPWDALKSIQVVPLP